MIRIKSTQLRVCLLDHFNGINLSPSLYINCLCRHVLPPAVFSAAANSSGIRHQYIAELRCNTTIMSGLSKSGLSSMLLHRSF